MAVTINTIGRSVEGEYDNVKDTFPQSTTSTTITNEGIATTNNLVAGTTYVTATGVATTGGTGTGCTVDITAVAGNVTVVAINNPGTGYTIADTLTITGGAADATFDVLTLQADTVSSVNGLDKKIVGVLTQFTLDVEKGDYIWFTTTDEVVEVENIVDDLNLTLKQSLLTTVTGVAYKIVRRPSFHTMSWLIDAADAATINNIAYPLSTSKDYGNDKPNFQGGGDRLAPILVDSTTNGNVVYVSGE